MRTKCGLGDVVRVHMHLVVPAAQVDLGEAGTLQLVQELVDHQDREFVLDDGIIEGAEVGAKAPTIVMLADQEHRGGKW
jgi:hypothetical protein